MANQNIGKEAIKAGTTFKKGKSGNPNGRPRKGVSLVNKQLKNEGYSPATKSDIEINYMSIINLPKSKLEKLLKDENQPMLIRILIKNILGKNGFDVIEKMLDRGIGKATQVTDNKHTGSFTLTDGLLKVIKTNQKKER